MSCVLEVLVGSLERSGEFPPCKGSGLFLAFSYLILVELLLYLYKTFKHCSSFHMRKLIPREVSGPRLGYYLKLIDLVLEAIAELLYNATLHRKTFRTEGLLYVIHRIRRHICVCMYISMPIGLKRYCVCVRGAVCVYQTLTKNFQVRASYYINNFIL